MALYRRPKKDGIFWAAFRHRGRRIRRSLETRDRTSAKRKHDELAARLHKETEAGRTLSDALIAWLDDRPRNFRDLNSVKLIREAHEDCALINISQASVEEAFKDRKPGRYNRLMSIVRRALQIARRKEWIESVPVFTARMTGPRVAAEPLTAEKWAALRPELPEHLQDMADFALATGLRWENIAMLEWTRVSLDNELCWIHAWQAKARKAISVPLSPAAIAVLTRRQAHEDFGTGFVFTYRGRPILSPKTAWNKAVKRAGLEGFRWHDMRHTWASWHAMNGTPLDVLQTLGGWGSRAMVDTYKHLAPSHVAQYAGNASPPEWPQKKPQSKRKQA